MSLWAVTRKLGLSKHRSESTFIDFSLQCELELENWHIVKECIDFSLQCKLELENLHIVKERCAETDSRPFLPKSLRVCCELWSKICPTKQPNLKSHFCWRVHWAKSRDLRQQTWYSVDTSWWYQMTLSRRCLALRRRPTTDGCWHWHWDTQATYNCYICQNLK